jgi:uncharacterized RDD family membrane protein YckC
MGQHRRVCDRGHVTDSGQLVARLKRQSPEPLARNLIRIPAAPARQSSVDRDQLRILESNGVESRLEIAGAGSRSYAFVIDWHIRLLLALAWLCAAWLLVKAFAAPPELFTNGSRMLGLVAVTPAIGIYLLYHPLLEILMRGSTPGKRRAGVRIVTRQGRTPSLGALLIRNVMRLVDSLPLFYVVGLASCLITAQRVRLGDLAAGTLLVLDSETTAKTLARRGSMVAQSGLPPALAELIHDLLERWPALDIARRDQLACSILASADISNPATQLATLGDAELLRRLRELVDTGHINHAITPAGRQLPG